MSSPSTHFPLFSFSFFLPFRHLAFCLALLAALVANAPAAQAASDGYYCAGTGYLAYERRLESPGILSTAAAPSATPHTLTILRFSQEKGMAEPVSTPLPDFQVHVMTCRDDGILLAGFRGENTLFIALEPPYTAFPRQEPALVGEPALPPDNLGPFSVSGVRGLRTATTGVSVFELVTTQYSNYVNNNKGGESPLVLHYAHSALVQRDMSGKILDYRTLYFGNRVETVD